MAAANVKAGAPQGVPAPDVPKESTLTTVLKIIGLMVFNAFALILLYSFFRGEEYGLATVLAVITIGVNVVSFFPNLYPLRWMTAGFIFLILLVVYPIISTVSTAFTNYGDGNLFPKAQSIQQIIRVGGTIQTAEVTDYKFFGYENDGGGLAVWLTRELPEGGVETIFATQGSVTPVENAPETPPASYEGYTLLSESGIPSDGRPPRELNRFYSVTDLGTATDVIAATRNGATRASGAPEPRYSYDTVADAITDKQTGAVYRADDTVGDFRNTANQNDVLAPGYRVNVGFNNFMRLVNDPTLRGPLVDIFVWTVVFSFLSVVSTFAVGLGMALVLNNPRMPARALIRGILIIPYAIPGVISVVVWRGMLNYNLGVVTDTAQFLVGFRPQFLLDPWLAKFSILLVNLWLGYPYMMLICQGALQGIPSEVYEAAAVDGAKPHQRFWQITLPLLLVSVGPLLVASFTFNFNNYLLIRTLTDGAPVIAGSPVPAGHTDILISYVYKSAFGNRGADYGYASAITIVIFLIVASLTVLQFRLNRRFEEVGENV